MNFIIKQSIGTLLLLIYANVLHATNISIHSVILGVAYVLFKGADILNCTNRKKCPLFDKGEYCSPIHTINNTPFLQCYLLPLIKLIPNLLSIILFMGIITELFKRSIHSIGTEGTNSYISSNRLKFCLLFPIAVILLYNFILI